MRGFACSVNQQIVFLSKGLLIEVVMENWLEDKTLPWKVNQTLSH